jgi:hypothetical protein
MNLAETLKTLRERRDFYGAAVTAVEQIAQLEQTSVTPDAPTATNGKRFISTATRRKMAAAQRARWAEKRAAFTGRAKRKA